LELQNYFIFSFSYDSVEKVLLTSQHTIAGVMLTVKKDQADYWIQAKNIPAEMSVKELCDIISAQTLHWVAAEEVILFPGDGSSQLGEAVIKNHKRQPMLESTARFLASMWTTNAISATSPVRFEALRARVSPEQLCPDFQRGPCPFENVTCKWEHIVCSLGINCRNEQCWLGHPLTRKAYPRILNEGLLCKSSDPFRNSLAM